MLDSHTCRRSLQVGILETIGQPWTLRSPGSALQEQASWPEPSLALAAGCPGYPGPIQQAPEAAALCGERGPGDAQYRTCCKNATPLLSSQYRTLYSTTEPLGEHGPAQCTGTAAP